LQNGELGGRWKVRGSGEDNLLLFWMVRSMTLHIPQDGCHVGKIEKDEKRKRERGSRRCGGKEKKRKIGQL